MIPEKSLVSVNLEIINIPSPDLFLEKVKFKIVFDEFDNTLDQFNLITKYKPTRGARKG